MSYYLYYFLWSAIYKKKGLVLPSKSRFPFSPPKTTEKTKFKGGNWETGI